MFGNWIGQKALEAALLAAMIVVPMAPAMAAPHPRVREVNARFGAQHARIQQGIHNGSIGPKEARRLHREYGAMKAEEHVMRAADGGHLTRADQRILNRQLNARSSQVYRFKHN